MNAGDDACSAGFGQSVTRAELRTSVSFSENVVIPVGKIRRDAVKDIIAFAKENLNHWSVPVSISILEAMPLTKMNKTDYKALEKHD